MLHHKTALIFSVSLLLGLGVAALALLEGTPLAWLLVPMLIGEGLLLRLNETRGFSRSKEMYRVGDPARHFNLAQVFILYALIMGQLVILFYALSH